MAKKDRPDVTETAIGLRDVGMTGRIHNGALLALAEEALSRFWQARPVEENEPEFRATKFEARLYEALEAGEKLRFTVTVDKIGVKSVGFAIAVDCGNRRAADLEIVWTAVEPQNSEAVALPEDLRDWLYQWLP
ncbi:hypothetical protein NAC44_19540 [Allorhizobium sp. BGMRC 0089]|uniref:hotdog domain-containing protein n=1 Tax=Allorhizobium sonneratiae TaxID=2934936 RepID=UPI00203472C5|nr:hotdog domain-containing protein [Allorhizobium sonneratiae]MCM2294525.1 hypothetical protein [Allorhizobium sonneratiae]